MVESTPCLSPCEQFPPGTVLLNVEDPVNMGECANEVLVRAGGVSFPEDSGRWCC